MKGLADDQSSSITKGSIYYIKKMYMQPFSMEKGWSEIWCLMKVSTNTMFYIKLCFYFVGQTCQSFPSRLSWWCIIHCLIFIFFHVYLGSHEGTTKDDASATTTSNAANSGNHTGLL